MRRFVTSALLIWPCLVLIGCSFPIAETPTDTTPFTTTAATTTQPTTSSPLIVSIQELPQSTAVLGKSYTWQYGGKIWTWDISVPEAVYDYYRKLPRPPTVNYSVYVTHPWDDDLIDDLVSEFKDAARVEGYDAIQTVELATAFVQSLPYTADSVTTPYDEYPRYPVETLVDKGGDCEDTSILLASLIHSLGYDVVLIAYPGRHMAVGVLAGDGIQGSYYDYQGEKYYYIETTDVGWPIGQLPEEYKGSKANLYDMTPIPILTHTWDSNVDGNNIELTVTVDNIGSADAKNVFIFAGFDAGDNMLSRATDSEVFNVPMSGAVTARLTLEIPRNIRTRLVVQIIYEGYAVDQSYSTWMDT